MKCLLINPPVTDNYSWDLTLFPHGLGYIAASLAKTSLEVQVLDIFVHKMQKPEVSSVLKEELLSADWVGISGIVNGYKYIRWLASEIKRLAPGIPLVVGGSICSPNVKLLLESIEADICCISEGEETVIDINKIIAGELSPEHVPGIAYKKDGRVIVNPSRPYQTQLERFDFPYWEVFDMEQYITASRKPDKSKKRSMSIIGSRGCPYHCKFCSPNFGRHIRVRPIQSIIHELTILTKRYAIEHFQFMDELFFINEHHTRAFCKELIDAHLDFVWWARGRANIFDTFSEDTFLLMKNSGCRQIAFGLESGSQKILDLMNKNVTVQQMEAVIRKVRKAGMRFSGNFIFGYPGETQETIKETIAFCKENMIPPPNFTFACPLPGSKLYDECIEKGLIKNEISYWEQIEGTLWEFVINLTQFSDEELQRLREEAFWAIKEWTAAPHPV